MTDLQMFALNTIHIPLPGRHPLSPASSNTHSTPPRPNSSQQTASSRMHSDFFDSFSSLKLKSSSKQKASHAMSRLQGYHGLSAADQKGAAEGCEMAVYKKGQSHYLEDGPLPISSIYIPLLSHHRKLKSVANCLESENGSVMSQEAECNNSAKWFKKLVKRRQNSLADFRSHTPEKLMKEESITISAITGKGLALRPKSASQTVSAGVDLEAGGFNPIPMGLGDSFLTEDVDGAVRKSSSGSSWDSLSSVWATSKWSLKPYFQALSAAGWRNKAAVD